VILRNLQFSADLTFEVSPSMEMLALLSFSTLALRHLGSGRNRGRGHVRCTLSDEKGEEIRQNYLSMLEQRSEETVA
jgi:hypothetical protein